MDHLMGTPPQTMPLEQMTMSPQLANTLEHIVGQLDILTQVHMTRECETEINIPKYCIGGSSIASFPGHFIPSDKRLDEDL